MAMLENLSKNRDFCQRRQNEHCLAAFQSSFIHSLISVEFLQCTGLIQSFPPQNILTGDLAQYASSVGMGKEGYF